MGDLTTNFSRKEFACQCGCGYDDIDSRVVVMAQTIREAVGAPVRINSGCRCMKRNIDVGGVAIAASRDNPQRGVPGREGSNPSKRGGGDSYHALGKAADLSIDGSASKLYLIIKILWKEGRLPDLAYCKRYVNKNFVHIDCGPKAVNIFAEGN
ncbi:hypothetical protein FACS1894204_04130 [Synergistales bacterium]|nr:hypothetical protein FACS1894204_04130 [Synergistales bacterium]